MARRGRTLAALSLLSAASAVPAGAEPAMPPLPEALQALPRAGTGEVAAIESGHELLLADGRVVRLAGILAPLPDARDGVRDGLARAAAAALARHAEGGRVALFLAAAEPDRYGRLRAHLTRARDGLWLQGALLRAGHVRAFVTPDTAAGAAALYDAEAEARAARRGLWAEARYRPQPAASVRAPPGTYTIVTGRVRDAAKVGGTVYLNFGADWRTDFTLRLLWPVRRQYPETQRSPVWWEGRRLEMRGMLEHYNGPMITPGHPAQIRLLEEPPPASAAGRDGERPG